MSNIKDLFSSKKSDKLLENATGRDIGSSVESADYLQANIKDKQRFIPHVDFSSASNFAIYGSAEKYYEDAYNYVLKGYPYDGSLREKIDWSLSGTYLDRYIFENEYPRTTGYINFGNSYGSVSQATKGYDSSTINEWIYFKGHNVDYSLNAQSNPKLSLQFNNLNIYNTASQGISNLELEGSGGVSVEFWLQKSSGSFNSANESRRQVIVDLWNSSSWSSAAYGRLRIEISGTDGNVVQPNFHVELLSGTSGFSSDQITAASPTIILSGSTLTGSWNQFALTFVNTGSQMTGRLYTNGNLTYTYTGGTSIGLITGSMLGQIGSLLTTVSGAAGINRGDGKLAASLDEFRFWKTRRNDKQVGQYWFTQVAGGTNTDLTLALTASTKYSYENPADLGFYYKFNEGIINTSSINPKDTIVLDYAGRVTDGVWTGYSVGSRNTGSAMVSSSAAIFEFADPILYSSHPLVSSSLDSKKDLGRFYDETNNSSMYGSLPEWITSDDQNKGNSALRNLTQIMASYFDTLYLQTQAVTSLKNKDYISGSDKPFPFVNRFIDSSGFLTSEIFSKATDLEYLDARNNKENFDYKVNEVKNLIYKNIYNNLVYIYKTKGTQKSFRNLIRSFGVDKELINIRLYADEVTYNLQDNYDNSTIRKRYANFHSSTGVNSVVYQQTASNIPYSRGYIGDAGDLVNTKAFDFGSQPGSNPGAAIQLNDTSFTGSGGSFSISVWSKQDINYTVEALVGRMDPTSTWGNDDFMFGLDRSGGGQNRMGLNTDAGYKEASTQASERIDDGEWHLVVGGFDADAEKVWINIDNGAATDDSPTAGGTPSGSWGSKKMSIGNYYDGTAGYDGYLAATQWSGSMDEVGFWSGSLSTADINEIYNTGCPGNLENHTNAALLKSWYRMGDLSTDSATADTGEITDVMGNNDGTPKNTDGDEIVTRSECLTSSLQYRGNTYELESFFPKDKEKGTTVYFNASFQTASIFGCHTSGTAGSTAWGTPDYGNFQVSSIRTDIRRKAAYFHLTGTAGGFFPSLTSSVFQDVYDGSRWSFAVRIKPKKYPLAAGVTGSNTGQYDVEFSGYNYVLDVLNNSFVVTASLAASNAQSFLKTNKRFFVGAHRTNTTGTVLQQSNIQATSLRVWMNYLTSSVLKAHAKDVTNFGSANPYRDAYITQQGVNLGSKGVKAIPELETLILNWDFDTVTGSDGGGNFIVPDVSIASSGSNNYTGRWGWLGSIGQYQHTGYGFGFAANATGSIERRYVHTLELQAPETINSSDMISLIDEEQNKLFTKDTRPEQYFFAFEKSMYNIISQEILDIFATIIDFNNLIGEPVNRYRQEYKSMQKLRQLYFERVQNTLNLNKFVEYFKWLDSSISVMLQQLVPGSAKFSENLRTMIESHVLERNKYWSKFPTLEMKPTDPEAGLFGINEMLYSGKRGIAPIPTTATGSNCLWWHDRANRDNPNITSSNSTVNSQRDTIRLADDFKSATGPTLAVSRDSTATTTTYTGQAYALRNFTKIYNLTVDESLEIHGGSNFPRGKKLDYAHTQIKINPLGSAQIKLRVTASSIDKEKGCTDVINPSGKQRLEGAFVSNQSADSSFNGSLDYEGGTVAMFAPFSLFSSSNTPSYLTNFRSGTQLTNYHDDSYGDDNETPMQGPFTDAHVGGWQYRHQNINTGAVDTTATRPEAWELAAQSGYVQVVSRNYDSALPRATMIRDAYAKRPVNIANIKWGTSSAVVGNYRKDYQMLQTSGRKINNRFFVANGGFNPTISESTWIDGLVDYALPRFDLTGTNQFIFVERFSAPGGPEVNSRGAMDINAEEYSVYNELNLRNSIVRNALTRWQTEHCGQFGIDPTGSPGDGSVPSEHRTNPLAYSGVIAAYHKTNRNTIQLNPRSNSWVEWSTLLGNMTTTPNGVVDSSGGSFASYAFSKNLIYKRGSIEGSPTGKYVHASLYTYMGFVDKNQRGQTTTVSTSEVAWPLAWKISVGISNIITAQPVVNGTTKGPTHTADIDSPKGKVKYKIVVNGGNAQFLYSENFGANWIEILSTASLAQTSELYGAVVTQETPSGVAFTKMKTFQYDNWFVQHDIPQSTLQYKWINNSYNNSKDQPLGYTGGSHDNAALVPFTVPSGTTSMTASAVQFLTASNWEFAGITNGVNYPVNFTNMLSFLPTSVMTPENYKYLLNTSRPRVPAGWYDLRNLTLSADGKTLTKTMAGVSNWDGAAAGQVEIDSNGYIEFTADQTNAYLFVGLNDDPPAQWTGGGPAYEAFNDMEYSIELQVTDVEVWESGTSVFSLGAGIYAVGWKFRITRLDNNILYQHDNGTNTWTTFYKSTKPITKKLLPDISICCDSPNVAGSITVSNIVVNVEPKNTIAPGVGYWEKNGVLGTGAAINSYFNNINGSYQYPSWKQIRTGETPVARYQKNNNILSVGSIRGMVTVQNGSGTNKEVTYFDARTGPGNIRNFVEPPVTFKYRGLISNLNNIRLKHSYGNNKCLWAQRGLPLGDQNAVSIAEYLGYLNYTTQTQIYDKLKKSSDYQSAFKSLIYPEVIYPRGANTGLAKIRGRLAYAETASVNTAFPPTASLSLGSNGIDRGPLYRRTLWRNSNYNRNRYGAPEPASGSVGTSFPWFTTTISNSCGNQDGQARSVWCFGEEPLVFGPPSSSIPETFVGVAYLSGASSYANNNGRDTGELNSINIVKMGGLMGGVSGSLYPNSFNHHFYTKPSASAYYYWLPYYGREGCSWLAGALGRTNTLWTQEFSKGMKWTAAKDSGKNPWFDSYEEYAEDIRGLSKAWTVLPEFKISDHMNYYVETKGGDFRSKNDQFLSLNGANITQSADVGGGFNTSFFKEYSFSDFQKYIGTFYIDHGLEQITLKCTGVKKLLPYKGFYPADRTTQLVSLFSGALEQYVTGGAVSQSWSEGMSEPHRVQSGSTQLAMQALMQPWFAPGILYNTIKSGIAVDWPVLTGTLPVAIQPAGFVGSWGFISSSANTRFPFQSLLEPIDYIPISKSATESPTADHRMIFLAPSYDNSNEKAPGVPYDCEPSRTPYGALKNPRPTQDDLSLYSSAMHNYLAEIPHFFLKDESLKSVVSLPQNLITIAKGEVYIMDVYLEKSSNPRNELVMIQDYYNGYVSGGFDGYGTTWGAATATALGEIEMQVESSGIAIPAGDYIGITSSDGTEVTFTTGLAESCPTFDAVDSSAQTVLQSLKTCIEGSALSGKVSASEPTNDAGSPAVSTMALHQVVYGPAGNTTIAENVPKPDFLGAGNAGMNFTNFVNGVDPRGQWVTGSYNGKYFGPKWWCRGYRGSSPAGTTAWYDSQLPVRDCDPAFAPHTPPYFYGKSRVRLIYTGSADDAARSGGGLGPNFRKIFNNMTMSFKGADDLRNEAWTKFEDGTAFKTMQFSRSAAYQNMMDVTASLSIKGIKVDPSDPTAEGLNRWVISPFMETPVLDFSSSQTPEPGYGRGMWSGYGEIPSNNKGIYFGVERSPNVFFNRRNVKDMTEWFRNTRPTQDDQSVMAERGSDQTGRRRKVGEIAPLKEISEAIVAIPFCVRRITKSSGLARTISAPIIDKFFFSLGPTKAKSKRIYAETKSNINSVGLAIPGQNSDPSLRWLSSYYQVGTDVDETSISKMALMMRKYVLPPQLDFDKYSDIEPFAMYIMEFTHKLSDQDLADIWQGLMPKISTNAELGVSSISHGTEPYQFFGGKKLPPNDEMRWMVFKIKRQAAINYWSMTPSSIDDVGSRTETVQIGGIGGVAAKGGSITSTTVTIPDRRFNPNDLDYSYNWPYDYFSLVELAQVETIGRFAGSPDRSTGILEDQEAEAEEDNQDVGMDDNREPNESPAEGG